MKQKLLSIATITTKFRENNMILKLILRLISCFTGVAFVEWLFIAFLGWKPYAGPICGAFLGTAITLAITSYQKNYELENNKRHFIRSLIAELGSLRKTIIEEQNGRDKITEPLIIQEISEDYFTIFSQNANKIGLLPGNAADKTISTYIEMKGLFDTIRCVSNLNKKALERNRALDQLNYPEFTSQTTNDWDSGENYKILLKDKTSAVICLIDDTLNILKKLI